MRVSVSLLFVVLFLGSCSSGKIAIEVLRPPVQEFSIPVKNIAIMNRVLVNVANTKQYVNGTVISQFNGITDQMVNEAKSEFVTYVNSNQFANTFDTTLKYVPKNATYKKSGLPRKVGDKICQDLGVDLIVSIEAYNAEIDTDSDIQYSTPVDRNYGTVRIPYFTGDQSVYMEMLFRAYSCTGNSTKLEAETQIGNQVSKTASGSNVYEVNIQMADAGNVLIQAARNVGKDYAESVSPKWESVDRKIYKSGSPQMKSAYQMAKSGNWPRATDEWYLLASSNSESIAKPAIYNLIVASEVSGDFDLAMEWATTCINKYNLNAAKEYLAILKTRKDEVAQMEKMYPMLQNLK